LEFAAFKGWNKPMTELAAAIFDPSTKFEDLSWLQSVWSGPIIVKGVQNLDDAKKLAGMGVAGIVLSNHGGRQLERGPVPLELLPEVVAAVGDKVEIYVDGAVLSGQDVYAAITLGAKAVFIGRAYLYGLMAGGKDGVQKVIEILERDLINTMALTGASSIAEGQKFGARIRSN
jgi:isopentenyl diphosphate isomerase/L-lactate dehydrogenase-like FMN-dependent dehydrogenase